MKSFLTGRNILAVCLICLSMLIGSVSDSLAQVKTDIRSDSFLADGSDRAFYVIAIDNCSVINSISVSAGDTSGVYSPSEARRIPGSATGCELPFLGTGDNWHNPSVTLNYNNSTTAAGETHP